MAKVSLLEAVSLEVLGTTEVNLMGGATAATWTPFGCSYSTRCPEYTPEKSAAWVALGLATRALFEKATKAELVAWYEAVSGAPLPPWETKGKKSEMITMCMILANEKRFPRVFVNEKA